MKILWISNIEFPEAITLIKGEKAIFKGSGGWLLSSANRLVTQQGLKLSVAFISGSVKEVTRVEGEYITYYLIPHTLSFNRDEIKKVWQRIRKSIMPDVVHIHGTEMSHGLSYIEACGSEGVCVSIQGIISACAQFYNYGLTNNEIRNAATIASLYFGGMRKKASDFEKRGESEKELLSKVQHIIGRTSWDRTYAWECNPAANYYHGGESLREEFYTDDIWSYSKCIPHRIFLSQSSYPLKGLHMVLRALPLVLRHFPDTTIHVAGIDITRNATFKQKILLSDYGNLIRKLIKFYNLNDSISFTGPLDAVGMKREYLLANIFVCPSSVENSPNSLGEAQILGVPSLASFVGGVPDMMRGDEQHMYRYEDTVMLAYKIVDLFSCKGEIDTDLMRKAALMRHDPDANLQELLQIYHSIISK